MSTKKDTFFIIFYVIIVNIKKEGIFIRTIKEKDLDNNFNKTVGIYLKNIREKQNMTMEQLAVRVRTTRQNIYKYENAMSRLKVDMFISICYALQLNPNDAYEEILDNCKSKGI